VRLALAQVVDSQVVEGFRDFVDREADLGGALQLPVGCLSSKELPRFAAPVRKHSIDDTKREDSNDDSPQMAISSNAECGSFEI